MDSCRIQNPCFVFYFKSYLRINNHSINTQLGFNRLVKNYTPFYFCINSTFSFVNTCMQWWIESCLFHCLRSQFFIGYIDERNVCIITINKETIKDVVNIFWC